MSAPQDTQETLRLARLRDLLVLDSPPEPLFDSLARMASEVCGTPIALLSLVDAERQWFKANVGLPGTNQTARDIAFCAQAIEGSALFEVADASTDPRFADNPLVTGDPGIRFYAGMPLSVDDGARIGTLCVIDRQPRQLDAAQAKALADLALLAAQALTMRRDLMKRALQVRSEQEQALAASEARYRSLVEQQQDMISLAHPDGRLQYVNPAYARQFGMSQDELVGRNLFATIDPADQAAVRSRFDRLLDGRDADGGQDGVNRIIDRDGQVRWIAWSNSLQRDARGQPVIHSAGRDITERKQMELRLAEAAEELHDLYDKAPCGYYSLDAEGRFIQANERTLAWLGATREEVLGKLTPMDFFTEAGRHVFRLMFPTFKVEGRLGPMEFELRGRDGRRRWVSVTATAAYDADGQFVKSRSVMYDVTEVHAARAELRQLSIDQNAMLDNEVVGIVKLRDGMAVWKNRALDRMFGYDADELLGQPSRLLFKDDASYAEQGRAAAQALATTGHHRVQLQLRRKDERLIWVDASGTLLSRETGEAMWVLADITQLKEYQLQIEHIAFHDALTGLPNRLLLADRLHQAIALARRLNQSAAVCYVDLDGFKAVNDCFGHDAGDELLVQVARRMAGCLRASDTVARLGGDEFVVLLAPLDAEAECIQVLERMVAAVAEVVTLSDGALARISASVGVAIYPRHGTQTGRLLSRADAALYESKRAGRNRITLAD